MLHGYCSLPESTYCRDLQVPVFSLPRRAYKRPVLKPKAAPDPVSQQLAALKAGAPFGFGSAEAPGTDGCVANALDFHLLGV